MINRVSAPAIFRWPTGALLAAGVLLACACAQAQDSVAAFYRGRTIPIIIGVSARGLIRYLRPAGCSSHGQIYSGPSQFDRAEQAGRNRRHAVFLRDGAQGRLDDRHLPRNDRDRAADASGNRQMERAGLVLRRLVCERQCRLHGSQGRAGDDGAGAEDNVHQCRLQYAGRRFLHQSCDHEEVRRAQVQDHLRLSRHRQPSDRARTRRDRHGDGRMDGLEEPSRGHQRRREAHHPVGTWRATRSFPMCR